MGKNYSQKATGKRNSRGKKDYRKYDKADNNKEFVDIKSATNDIGWHALDSQMLNDAARLSFGYFNGRRIPYNIISNSKITDTQTGNFDTAGIMSVALTPTVGVSRDVTSPINIAAQLEYSKLRTKNSGIWNLFQRMDLIMYYLAFNEIIKFVSVAKRLYGYLRTAESRSAYSPNAVVRAMGFDYYSFAEHAADFRAWLNIFIQRANKVFVPKDWRLFAESDYLYSNVFKDMDQEQCQLYVIKPQLFLKWNGVYDPAGTCLMPEMFTSAKYAPISPMDEYWNYENFTNLGNDLLECLVDNDDTGYISGAVLNYYGEENCWQFTYVPDDYYVFPIYDEVICYRIENCTPNGFPKIVWNKDELSVEPYIYQTQGDDESASPYIICDLATISDYGDQGIQPILNLPTGKTGPEVVMEVTRWTNAANMLAEVTDGDGNHYFEANYLCTSMNMVTGLQLYTYKYDGQSHQWGLIDTDYELSSGALYIDKAGMSNVNSHLNILSRLSQFAHCPHIKLIAVSSSSARTSYFDGQLCQLESFYLLRPEDTYKMHMCDLITEFTGR